MRSIILFIRDEILLLITLIVHIYDLLFTLRLLVFFSMIHCTCNCLLLTDIVFCSCSNKVCNLHQGQECQRTGTCNSYKIYSAALFFLDLKYYPH